MPSYQERCSQFVQPGIKFQVFQTCSFKMKSIFLKLNVKYYKLNFYKTYATISFHLSHYLPQILAVNIYSETMTRHFFFLQDIISHTGTSAYLKFITYNCLKWFSHNFLFFFLFDTSLNVVESTFKLIFVEKNLISSVIINWMFKVSVLLTLHTSKNVLFNLVIRFAIFQSWLCFQFLRSILNFFKAAFLGAVWNLSNRRCLSYNEVQLSLCFFLYTFQAFHLWGIFPFIEFTHSLCKINSAGSNSRNFEK